MGGLSYQTRGDRGSNLLYLELKFSEVPQIEVPSLVGTNAVEPPSGPLAEIGRVYPSVTPASVVALVTRNAPIGSALSALGITGGV